jgi:hypothetical protein
MLWAKSVTASATMMDANAATYSPAVMDELYHPAAAYRQDHAWAGVMSAMRPLRTLRWST